MQPTIVNRLRTTDVTVPGFTEDGVVAQGIFGDVLLTLELAPHHSKSAKPLSFPRFFFR